MNDSERAALSLKIYETSLAGQPFDAKHVSVDGEFIRDLILGKYATPGTTPNVRLENCHITSTVNITGAKIDHLVSITMSRIDGDFICNYADMKVLFLDGTTLRAFKGVRCSIATSIYMRARAIDTNHGPNPEKPDDDQACQKVVRFKAENGIDLSGSKIQGALSARGATIKSGKKFGLNIADSEISSILIGPKDDDQGLQCDDGRSLNDTQIFGTVNFQRARCYSFNDSENTYADILGPSAGKAGGDGSAQLILRGFVYQSLGRKAPRTSAFRLAWLEADAKRDEAFDPFTYEQLAKVLRNQGHHKTALDILIRKEVLQNPWFSKSGTVFDILFRPIRRALLASIDYGYRTHKLIPLLLTLIFVGGLVFNTAFARGHLSPTNVLLSRSLPWETCQALKADDGGFLYLTLSSKNAISVCKNSLEGNSEAHRAMRNYPDFNGYWYAADVFIPILTLRQEEFWVPPQQESAVWSIRTVSHIYTIVGWILSSLGIVSALSYLRRD